MKALFGTGYWLPLLSDNKFTTGGKQLQIRKLYFSSEKESALLDHISRIGRNERAATTSKGRDKTNEKPDAELSHRKEYPTVF